jgi:hypothetical protein
MELITILPLLLAILMVAAMLALSSERFGANRKLRDDERSFQERMRRNHGEARRRRQDPPTP